MAEIGDGAFLVLGTDECGMDRHLIVTRSALYEELKRVCDASSGATKTACTSTAWTYYQAVKVFG